MTFIDTSVICKRFNKNKSVITRVFYNLYKFVYLFISNNFKNSIENEIKNNSRMLLGGDLELSTKIKP